MLLALIVRIGVKLCVELARCSTPKIERTGMAQQRAS